MKHQEINQLIDQAESEMLQLSDTVAQLKLTLANLIEENNQLRMTNDELRDLLLKRSNEVSENLEETTHNDEPQMVSGKERLQSFYEEGIHICHPYFGSRRLPEEECIFCQGIIDSLDSDSA